MAENPVSLSEVERIRAHRSPERAGVSDIMKGVRGGYFGTDTDTQLDDAMNDMFDDILETLDAMNGAKGGGHLGRLSEGYPLLCTGLSGTRKSSTVARMISRRPEFAGFSVVPEENSSMAIWVKAPSPCTLRLLGIEIATAMGYRPDPDIKENVVWNLIRDNLANRGARIIVIDELQHVIKSKNVLEIGKIQDTIKSIAQTAGYPVWMIFLGLPEISRMVEGDVQVWRRVEYLRFHTMSFPQDVDFCRRIVTFFALKKAGLEINDVTTDDGLHRLMHASLFRPGIAISILMRAIRAALKARCKELLPSHMAVGFAKLSGCDHDALNPFLAADDYLSINVAQYFTDLLDDETKGRNVAGSRRKQS